VLSTGSWQRPGRAARYRVPGWGDVNWRRVITALLETGYDGVLSFEHEDPVMSERDGLEKAIDHLRPLVIREPLSPDTTAWWMA
jgi:sugar phosphate isomerase/epimerase